MKKVSLYCAHCQQDYPFLIGHEEGEDTLEAAMKHFKGKTRLHIKGILKKHQLDAYRFGYEILACESCKILENPYTVEVEYDSIMLFRPYYKCQRCYQSLTLADHQNLEKYCCKQCGQPLLKQ